MPAKPILPIRQDDSDDSNESYYDEQGELPLRHAYIHSLANLLHACLLRGDIDRAKRAWAILIRCREVDWRARWQWGLLFLSSGSSDAVQNTQASMYASQAEDDYRQAERWINTLRVGARMEDKPSLLHALTLILIKHARYRQALEELETYLPSYPYLLSASLHTYAGLLAFYLAQPSSAIRQPTPVASQYDNLLGRADRDSAATSQRSSRSPSPLPDGWEHADGSLMRQARQWFVKAIEIDEKEDVAREFLRVIDKPNPGAEEDKSESDEDMESVQDEISEEEGYSDEFEKIGLADEYEPQ
ncbi:hypothetical protein CNBG_1147 [Cryptococcus deuterogattii R265]|uniref:RNA polymerase I-specific transcription initiation factor rrn11 n=1 Tax=Cryptococcus deuterogattii (strain R265) TaxID=294750 RepID=A0A095C6H5_CRYD2|nr:hypothetical protein CNBG_1147 [Cryptococcus deuterogattii R265]KIR30722.1 hypothetical protein I309_00071 [Cryptococcus deuterogattii LA55]KIR72632.1 hypothetical protein I310_03231 [Cryptococcus deuterogattii CA1014]KIR95186.1 hypothetical protein I304_01515 [Cryptococcus deuterogattii CBS 10090]KIS00292.1 hypothetical protein L804_01702 [Cryptococcus deuterogattii 2001/935-1]